MQPRNALARALGILLILLVAAGCGSPQPGPTPAPQVQAAAATSTPTPRPATATPRPEPSSTPTPLPPTDTVSPPTDTPAPTEIPPPQGPFVEHPVAGGVYGVCGLYVHDLDGDGDADILGAAGKSNEVAWWRNDGGEPIAWTKQTVGDGFSGAIFVYAADVDGDGDSDFLATAYQDSEIAWWRNEGGEPIAWTKQTVDSRQPEVQGIFAADLDGDGDTDILAAVAGEDKIAWWENDSPQGDGSSWEPHTIAREFRNTQTVYAADMDGDGDLDVVGGAGDGDEVAWWRNDGDGARITWTKQTIAPTFDWAHWVEVADVDGDGRLDVVGAAYVGDAITWWRNGGGDPLAWERQPVERRFDGALVVVAADLDGDGDLDLAGTADKASELAWWRNDGGGVAWTKEVIRADYYGAWPLHAGDLDGDGDVDLVSGSDSAHEITWWENRLDSVTP